MTSWTTFEAFARANCELFAQAIEGQELTSSHHASQLLKATIKASVDSLDVLTFASANPILLKLPVINHSDTVEAAMKNAIQLKTFQLTNSVALDAYYHQFEAPGKILRDALAGCISLVVNASTAKEDEWLRRLSELKASVDGEATRGDFEDVVFALKEFKGKMLVLVADPFDSSKLVSLPLIEKIEGLEKLILMSERMDAMFPASALGMAT